MRAEGAAAGGLLEGGLPIDSPTPRADRLGLDPASAQGSWWGIPVGRFQLSVGWWPALAVRWQPTLHNNNNIRPLFAVSGSATDGILRFVIELVLGRELEVVVFLLD